MTKVELELIDSIIDALTFVEESLNTGNMSVRMGVVRENRAKLDNTTAAPKSDSKKNG